MQLHVNAKHKVILVPSSAQLRNLFPQARVADIGGTKLILPHGLQETLMLRHLGHDVPAPIMTQYDWPGDKRPFRVQKLTASLFTTSQRCYCLNGMGTGKTKSALWAFDYLQSQGQATAALVVAPLSTLDTVWRAEVLRTVPHLSVGVLHGTREKRLKVLAKDHDIYIINTDGMNVIMRELQERTRIDTFIIDELALFRNGGAERSKAARKLAEPERMMWVWGLTGSPTPNEPSDAWGQCKIITPHTVPRYFTNFRDKLMVKVSNFKYVAKKDATEEVFRVMQPAVRFTLDDVVELPEVIMRRHPVTLGGKQIRVYEEMRKHAFAAIAKEEVVGVNAGAVLNKMLQISLGYVYSSTRGVVRLDNEARLEALKEVIEASEQKVIVFMPYTHAIDGVAEYLGLHKIEHAVIDGRVPKKRRDTIFTAFQYSNKYKAIVAHPAAMSHGLTLTAASTVVWFGPTTSLETFEQANARVRRIGQQHKQLIVMFEGSAVEQRIYARLEQKQKVQDNLLGLFADNTEG